MVELEVPLAVRGKAAVAGATDWLSGLPELIAQLERDWGMAVGRAYGDASEAYVAEATLADGTPAVLKVVVPRAGGHARTEAAVLRLAGGDGCARLLRVDEARGALLLERLGPSLSTFGLSRDRRHEVLCATSARLWRPAPDADLPTGADKAGWLAGHVETRWVELGRPCTREAVDHALACAERRAAAYRPDRAVLVHGDVHPWNTLRTLDGTGWKLIDPDGLLCEPEYDLGVVLREDPDELLAGDPYRDARALADRTGLDPEAIWEWGVVERVSTGLLLTSIGLVGVGRAMLAAADALATAR